MNPKLKFILWKRAIAPLQSRRGPAKAVALFVLVCFFVTNINVSFLCAQEAFILPTPGKMVALSPAFSPVVLKGIKLDPNNPFRFHFFVDTGDSLPLAGSKLNNSLPLAGVPFLLPNSLPLEGRAREGGIKFFS